MKQDPAFGDIETIKGLFKEMEEEALKDFFTFLSFESISTDPAYKESVYACADWLVDYLKALTFDVNVVSTSGYPVILASHLSAGEEKPTLLIYHHYDVQPIDPIQEWVSPPFHPTIRDGEVYARGAQDNKGQCFYTLQALKLFLKHYGKFPINIKLCIEGEEETGSKGLTEILPSQAEALKADYLAIVDVGLIDRNTPSVTLGIRGLVTMDVAFQGSYGDLHSGSHGGLAYNPLFAMAQVLSRLKDAEGRVTIPGFYDDVVEMSDKEKRNLSFDFDEKKYWDTFGIPPSGGEIKWSTQERVWLRPTLEINGMSGGYTGVGFKTVIPAKAHAKISCRLVPNQTPQKIGRLVAQYLESQALEGIAIKVTLHEGGGVAARVNPTSRVVDAFAQAFGEAFKKPCKYILDGATIPIGAALAKATGSDAVLVGLGLPDDQIHAPNEHFGIDRLAKGVVIMARAMILLGKQEK